MSKFSRLPGLVILSCALAVGLSQSGFAQQRPGRLTEAQSITNGEAHAIINGAIAFAKQKNIPIAVVVLDTTGVVVASDRMDGASPGNVHFAEGKAYAALMLRSTTETLSELAKTRPDRYFGIVNMYPGKVYLVGGGEPLAINGRMVGAVGVAGLPQGVDEMAGDAGMAEWAKYRAKK